MHPFLVYIVLPRNCNGSGSGGNKLELTVAMMRRLQRVQDTKKEGAMYQMHNSVATTTMPAFELFKSPERLAAVGTPETMTMRGRRWPYESYVSTSFIKGWYQLWTRG
jgi:hypothetical protein